MTIWFTSDLHIGHKNILVYDKRPFGSIEEHDQALIDRWNSVVKPEDLVYLCGDYGFTTASRGKEFLSCLNGRVIIICGNHDKHQIGQYYKMGFTAVLQEAIIKCGQSTFKLSHYPYRHPKWKQWWIRLKTGKKYTTINSNSPVKEREDWLLCGHRHSHDVLIDWKKKTISIACYMHNYKPISIDEIFRIISIEENKRKNDYTTLQKIWNFVVQKAK